MEPVEFMPSRNRSPLSWVLVPRARAHASFSSYCINTHADKEEARELVFTRREFEGVADLSPFHWMEIMLLAEKKMRVCVYCVCMLSLER